MICGGGFEADVKDTLLSEEGQQRGFRVCMALCYLFSQKNISIN